MKKMKNKALSLNLKKSFLILVIVGVIFGIGSGIAVYLNFGDRISQVSEYEKQQREEWLQGIEQNGQGSGEQSKTPAWGWYNRNDRYGFRNYSGEDSKIWNRNISDNEWEQRLNLSTNDKVLIGVLSGIGALLGIAYRVLCMIWAYQKADKMGSNKGLWVIATLFFNLWAIAAMYGYSLIRGTCPSCGQLKKKNEKYCSRCGAAYQQECSQCQAPVQSGSKFCPNCGETLEVDVSGSEQK